MSNDKWCIRGRAWVFGDDIDTDQIISGRYLVLLDYSEMAKHALEIPRPEFASQVKKDDIIVAGKNFGAGSSREEAPMVLKQLGIGCIVAESFARIFYRNSFNIGLPAIVLPDATKIIRDGETIEIDFDKGHVILPEKNQVIDYKQIPDFMMELLKFGGAVNWYREKIRQ